MGKKGLVPGGESTSHKSGNDIQYDIVGTDESVWIEGDEYHLCEACLLSNQIHEYRNKTNKEILDDIYTRFGCNVSPGEAHINDFIICKVSVRDTKKRNRTGTIKEIISKIQGENGCRVVNSSNIKKQGGKIMAFKPKDIVKWGSGTVEIESLGRTKAQVRTNKGQKATSNISELTPATQKEKNDFIKKYYSMDYWTTHPEWKEIDTEVEKGYDYNFPLTMQEIGWKSFTDDGKKRVYKFKVDSEYFDFVYKYGSNFGFIFITKYPTELSWLKPLSSSGSEIIYSTTEPDKNTEEGKFIEYSISQMDKDKLKEYIKGIEVEQEHKETLEKVAVGEIGVDEAIKETAEEHIKENPEYYEELEKIEKPKSDYESIPLDDLIKLQKERYSNVDIESPKSEDEKLLESVINQKFLKINSDIVDHRKEVKNTSITSFNISDYKNPYELNKAIEAFLDMNPGTEISRFHNSPEVITFLKAYSGYGGLGQFGESVTGTGLLYEFYTPDAIIQKMWALAYKYGYEGGNILDPACGTGELLKYAPKDAHIMGYEINKYSARIASILYPKAIIDVQFFERLFIERNKSIKGDTDGLLKYDLVIMNPPYGDLGGKYMAMGEDKYTKAKNFAEYFITRGLDLLNPDGLMIALVGAEQKNGGKLFLEGANTPAKEAISAKSTLVDAYRLPSGIFDRTGVTTEIIVLKKI